MGTPNSSTVLTIHKDSNLDMCSHTSSHTSTLAQQDLNMGSSDQAVDKKMKSNKR